MKIKPNQLPKMKSKNPERVEDTSTIKKRKGKTPSGGFQSMGLNFSLLKGILKRGYQIPTPIQRKTIPLLLTGKDLVGMARTGSGKTAAFLIPLFEKLIQQQQSVEIGTTKAISYPKGIILSPTRELALQTFHFAKDLSKFINPSINIVSILGGDSMDNQFELLHSKPHIVIATPGRFMHLLVEMDLKLNGVETIIFDEADRLFEMGFGVQINEIIHRLPSNRQTILFSATMPKVLVEFTKAGLNDPTLIRLDIETKLSENLKLVYVASRTEDKMTHLTYLLSNVLDIKEQQTIVFAATKYHVDYIHAVLTGLNIPSTYIYSSLDPSARKIALDKFRCKKCNILIVTDLAARGLDIPLLDNVINFHFPSKPKLFMHRVGRVARAGQSGTSYSIVSPDEMAYLLDLHLFLSKPLSFDGDSDGTCIGRVPQELLDVETNSMNNLLQGPLQADLNQLGKVCKNGYIQYIKSRPAASVESNRRAKDIVISNLPIHPILFASYKEDPLNSLITQMHTFRPKNTIFEIGAAKRGGKAAAVNTETYEIMKQKRRQDEAVITKFRQKKLEEAHVKEVENSARAASKKDENFINYLPSDYHTETGLSVGGRAEFNQQIQNSIMDLTGDDNEALKSQRSFTKWDSKKKKFVRVNDGNKNGQSIKKIRTESGAWISASYKSNRYEQWKSQSKVDHQGDDDDVEEDADETVSKLRLPQKNSPVRRNFRRKGSGKKLRSNSTENRSDEDGKKRFRTELKRPEVILKERKKKEAQRQKNLPKKYRKGNRGGGVNKIKGSKGKFSGGGGSKNFRKKGK